MRTNQRGIATITVLEVIGAFLAVFVGVYFGLVRQYIVAPSPETPTDWQSYHDPTYGFQLKHPAAWHSEQCSDRGPLNEIYLMVSFGDAPQLVVCNSDASLEGYVTVSVSPLGTTDPKELDFLLENLVDGKKAAARVDGESATRVEGITKQTEGPGPQPGLKYIVVFASKDNIAYRFLFINKPESANLFDAALKTFRFPETPSTPPAGCYYQQVQCITTPCDPQLICPIGVLQGNLPAHAKSYRNEEYGFEIRYPGGYIVWEPLGTSKPNRVTEIYQETDYRDFILREPVGGGGGGPAYGMSFEFFPNPGNLTPLQWAQANNNYSNFQGDGINSGYREGVFLGNPSIAYTRAGLWVYDITVVKVKNSIMLIYIHYADQDHQAYKDFYAILSTFKFIK